MSAQLDILNAAKAVIDGLAIATITRTVVRKKLFIGDRDTLPIIVVSPGKPEIEFEDSENKVVWRRPVWVTVVRTNSAKWDSEFTNLTWEETIRQALHKPTLSGASTVYDCDADPDVVYHQEALDSGYDATSIMFTFYSAETRSV